LLTIFGPDVETASEQPLRNIVGFLSTLAAILGFGFLLIRRTPICGKISKDEHSEHPVHLSRVKTPTRMGATRGPTPPVSKMAPIGFVFVSLLGIRTSRSPTRWRRNVQNLADLVLHRCTHQLCDSFCHSSRNSMLNNEEVPKTYSRLSTQLVAIRKKEWVADRKRRFERKRLGLKLHRDETRECLGQKCCLSGSSGTINSGGQRVSALETIEYLTFAF
jgi:hypothetical protein